MFVTVSLFLWFLVWEALYSAPMFDSSQAAATKQDIQMLMEEIGKLYDANQRWKDEIIQTQQAWKDEIIHEFKVVLEKYTKLIPVS